MQDERLLFGVAAVLAGIAVLELVLGFVYSPVLFAVAVPFAAAAYLLWYHASGRLRDRVESGRAGEYRRADGRGFRRERDADRGGFGAGPRDSYSGRRGGFSEFGARGRTRGSRAASGRAAGGQRGARVGRDGPSAAEAYRVLGLDADADPGEVQRAYREKVKSVHPDLESGDEDEFKRVKAAYERLQRE